MGRHGDDKRLWPSVLGLIGMALVAAAVVLLIIWSPHWMPKG